MKMKKKAAIAAAFLTMTNFSACSNFNQDVYGPPVREWEQEETSYDPEENQNVGVYGPPDREAWEYDETDTPEEEQDVGEEALNNE